MTFNMWGCTVKLERRHGRTDPSSLISGVYCLHLHLHSPGVKQQHKLAGTWHGHCLFRRERAALYLSVCFRFAEHEIRPIPQRWVHLHERCVQIGRAHPLIQRVRVACNRLRSKRVFARKHRNRLCAFNSRSINGFLYTAWFFLLAETRYPAPFCRRWWQARSNCSLKDWVGTIALFGRAFKEMVRTDADGLMATRESSIRVSTSAWCTSISRSISSNSTSIINLSSAFEGYAAKLSPWVCRACTYRLQAVVVAEHAVVLQVCFQPHQYNRYVRAIVAYLRVILQYVGAVDAVGAVGW